MHAWFNPTVWPRGPRRGFSGVEGWAAVSHRRLGWSVVTG